MNTTAAAREAHVSVATVRGWCRRGVIAATKTAGRWIIDAASLAARIAIGAMKRPARPAVLTADTMVAIGGRRWQKNGMDRVYLNNWTEFSGLDVDYYRSGNVASAEFLGRAIANGRVGGIVGSISKVYFDVPTGRLMFQHHGADALHIRFYDGERTTVDLLGIVSRSIRAAVAAL
ncbi:helix-turn-helix domain-containing protein [Streptomyces sp. NRRL F-5135]|uniref:helix-turn-helix domain-containing protein n=1 Tax=Streptomyces sp. NRRL F-5135 TaxID=1463858 RepID=UPI000A52C260|nr:helix-turn-helix domain-containing protein [Streptomyces sp. NRRL F-5135]